MKTPSNIEEGCIVIQSCDRYHQIWDGLFWSMNKYWDFEIPWPIYFCNEEKEINLPNKKYHQIKTKKDSHANMMAKIMKELKNYKYVFYMLDDFWPTDRMDKETFIGLFKIFKENNWDSLKVTTHQPAYYDLENTEFFLNGKKILKYSKESKWRFNQQASFWKRDLLEKIITGPLNDEHREERINTSLGVEIAMDENLKKLCPDAEIYLYNYLWYPVGGVMWRGELNFIGKQIEFERKVGKIIETNFR